MTDYLLLILKCIFFYFMIIVALRIMGKREVGELSIFDIVIYLVMSELLALSLTDSQESILKTLIPLVTLALLQITVSKAILQSQKLRTLIDGHPVILINHGIVDQVVMKKERYNIDDLMLQLRSLNIGSPSEVAYAILETNGKLSVLPLNNNSMKYPIPLIQDGVLNYSVMKLCGLDESTILAECKRNNIDQISDVFLCLYQKNGFYILKHCSQSAANTKKRSKRVNR